MGETPASEAPQTAQGEGTPGSGCTSLDGMANRIGSHGGLAAPSHAQLLNPILGQLLGQAGREASAFVRTTCAVVSGQAAPCCCCCCCCCCCWVGCRLEVDGLRQGQGQGQGQGQTPIATAAAAAELLLSRPAGAFNRPFPSETPVPPCPPLNCCPQVRVQADGGAENVLPGSGTITVNCRTLPGAAGLCGG